MFQDRAFTVLRNEKGPSKPSPNFSLVPKFPKSFKVLPKVRDYWQGSYLPPNTYLQHHHHYWNYQKLFTDVWSSLYNVYNVIMFIMSNLYNAARECNVQESWPCSAGEECKQILSIEDTSITITERYWKVLSLRFLFSFPGTASTSERLTPPLLSSPRLPWRTTWAPSRPAWGSVITRRRYQTGHPEMLLTSGETL